MVAFSLTVFLWVLPGLLAIAGLRDSPFGRAYESSMPEAAAALTGAHSPVHAAGQLAAAALHDVLG